VEVPAQEVKKEEQKQDVSKLLEVGEKKTCDKGHPLQLAHGRP
jgi:hypothetical protein